ncbi:MAG: hypothetical protein ACYC4R_07645 [Anaerolineae bacterium]
MRKRSFDLNPYGGKLLGAAALCLLGIPAAAWLLMRISGLPPALCWTCSGAPTALRAALGWGCWSSSRC